MKLVSIEQAAKICGISPQVLRHRVLNRRDIRIARYHPLRFRIADVMAYRAVMPPLGPQGRKSGIVSLVTDLNAHAARLSNS